MAWQSRRIAATLPVPWRWFRRTLERRQAADRARLLASTGATLHVRGQDLPAHWFREYMAYDPAADLVTIDRPGSGGDRRKGHPSRCGRRGGDRADGHRAVRR